MPEETGLLDKGGGDRGLRTEDRGQMTEDGGWRRHPSEMRFAVTSSI